jgi:phenylacetate-coenzyme A ligase PaaK-like adenylate-forming protein
MVVDQSSLARGVGVASSRAPGVMREPRGPVFAALETSAVEHSQPPSRFEHDVVSVLEGAPRIGLAMRTMYEVLRQRHVAEAARLLPEHLERIMWPAERLRAERQRRLRELLTAARHGSPWHRERLSGCEPDRITENDLNEIPVMTKDDLMLNFDSIVTDPALSLDLIEAHLSMLTTDAYLLDRYHAVESGGSSGRRGVFVYDWDAWTLCYLSLRRYNWRALAGYREDRRGPVVMAKLGAARPVHVSSAIGQTFSSPELAIHRFPMTIPMEEIVAGLNSLRPRVLEGYSSALYQLAHEARAGRLRIAPDLISAISEPLLPEIRAALQETWEAVVLNVWGASEAGGCAASCGHGQGMHLTDDLLLIEPVDAAGRPVPAGVPSAKVYLTNLYNLTLPLIRYEITDEVTLLDEPCACGSRHQRVEDIRGRHEDNFVYTDGRSVHPYVFESALAGERNLVEYQIRQTRNGASVTVVCQGEVDLEQLRVKVSNGLTALAINEPDVQIMRVERLPRLGSGKLKRFVPLADARDPGGTG